MINDVVIGKNLEKFREKLGLNQKEVASFLGVHREEISYYENGKRRIPLSLLERLADLYGVNLSDFRNENPVNSAINLAVSFRKSSLIESDLKKIAKFQKFVKNYIKMERIEHGNVQ